MLVIFFNFIFTILIGRKIYDIGSGLNMYNKNFIKTEKFMNFPNSMMFNPYLHFYSLISNYKVKFIPISWREDGQISNVNFFKF